MRLGAIKYARLCATHPRLDPMRIRTLKAMYRGGQHLLSDRAVMDQVLGRIGDESDAIYNERMKRAFYENLFAMVINQTSAGLAQDPCRLAHADETATGKVEPPKPYWLDLMRNATCVDEDGGDERAWDQVVRDIGVEALVCGWSWAQVDLPAPDPDAPPPTSLADQEAQGQLEAYVVPWPTQAVTDWSETKGKLNWVRTYECILPDVDPSKPRNTKVHRWTIWDAVGWTRYEWLEAKDTPLPNGDVEMPPKEEGPHTFGRVPWVRFDVCQQGAYLHIGDLLESLCRQYFTRSNGEAWQWTQNSFQQLYEFLAPEIGGVDAPVSQAQSNPSRAKKPRRAPGVVHERGNEDRAEFVGPNMTGADIGRLATQDLRDAILRVVAQMALSQDTSGAMLRRSADSKQQDGVAQEILLGSIGKRLLTFARQISRLLALAIGDTDPPALEGYERFNVSDVDDVINQSLLVETVDIPSATYKIEEKYRTAVTHLGDGISNEIKAKIRDELEKAITQDQIIAMKQMPMDIHAKEMEKDTDEKDDPPFGKKKDDAAA